MGHGDLLCDAKSKDDSRFDQLYSGFQDQKLGYSWSSDVPPWRDGQEISNQYFLYACKSHHYCVPQTEGSHNKTQSKECQDSRCPLFYHEVLLLPSREEDSPMCRIKFIYDHSESEYSNRNQLSLLYPKKMKISCLLDSLEGFPV